MPITLPPISRRAFLAGAVGAAVAPRVSFAGPEVPVDPHRFAVLSDIHIHGDRTFAKESTNPWDNLAQATGEILALPKRPAAVLVNGDLAAHQGNPEDYATLIEGLAPLRKAGLPVYLTMGNHDERDNFWQAVPAAAEGRAKGVEDRQVLLIESPRANLFMLDSLGVTAAVAGKLGAKQLAWLAKGLDARADKPAIVFVHHDPVPKDAAKITGLADTGAFMDVVRPRKQVKAYVFGHTHDWHVEQQDDGPHWVNLPPTAWLFQGGKPRGWVDLTLGEKGATFELRSLDVTHPRHGEKAELAWR